MLMEEGNPHDAKRFQFITEREDEVQRRAVLLGLFTSCFGHELYYDLARAGMLAMNGALGLIEAGIERETGSGRSSCAVTSSPIRSGWRGKRISPPRLFYDDPRQAGFGSAGAFSRWGSLLALIVAISR
jgi:hypothetical protein